MATRFTGELYSHTILWRTAEYFAAQATQAGVATFFPLLAATVFSYFAAEAYLNGLLREIAPEAYANERRVFGSRSSEYRGTTGKLRFLARECCLDLDEFASDLLMFERLERSRHKVAHGRIENVDYTADVEPDNLAAGVRLAFQDVAVAMETAEAMKSVQRLCDALSHRARDRFGNIAVGGVGGAFGGTDGALLAQEVVVESLASDVAIPIARRGVT